MADPKSEKTIEMRLAEIEDKLSQLHITEEEMKAYHKVSAALGGGMGAGTQAPSPTIPIARSIVVCRICTIRWNCYECICGPCNCSPLGVGGGFGGGFGGFGG
jgi:hypothetical protein